MSNYEFTGNTWQQNTVSWYFNGTIEQSFDITRAFNAWDDVLELDFARVALPSQADIDISFSFLDGEPTGFDTYGYATWRYSLSTNHIIDADIDFDSGNTWTWSPSTLGYVLNSGVTLYSVAVHEIGHAIGLDHSTNPQTLMYSVASSSNSNLAYWDIFGAQQLYGDESRLLPDLVNRTTPSVNVSSVAAGGNVTINYEVVNVGPDSASSSISGIYLSTDSNIITSDTRLSSDSVPELDSAERSDESSSVTISGGLAPGTYWLGVILDHANNVQESGETNNNSNAVQISVTPASPFTAGSDTVALTYSGYTWYALGGNDTVTGTTGVDVIYGNSGHDALFGLGGGDTIFGDNGDDTINGQLGNDTLNGDGGHDLILGAQGNDVLNGGNGNDIVSGGSDNDTITGGVGIDLVFGGGGDDLLFGNAGNDTLSGGGGTDTLSGGNNSDLVMGSAGDDMVFGGAGIDTVSGGTGVDTVDGGGDNDTVYGAGGDDTVSGGAGDDTVSGGADNDTVSGNAGIDSLLGASGTDRLDGGTGNDTLTGGAGADTLEFGLGYDADQVQGFEDDIDTLELDDALWGGGLTATQVVTTYATQTSPGIIDFNFGGGDTLRVIQGAGILTTDLFDDISIV